MEIGSMGTIQFEHRFWLQVLGDHARFILNALSPRERPEISKAEAFISLFDQFALQAQTPLSAQECRALSSVAHQRATELRNFKLHLLTRHLIDEVVISLPPSFLNHMVNEVDEYLRVLRYDLSGDAVPVFHPIHHHLLWLLDASGHASALANGLDATEHAKIARSTGFQMDFDHLYVKATELAAYMRTNLKEFPALEHFHTEAELEIQLFTGFLTELKELRLSKQALGTIMPLIPDHMLREECYYITKLSQVAKIVRAPSCDPTQPRIQDDSS